MEDYEKSDPKLDQNTYWFLQNPHQRFVSNSKKVHSPNIIIVLLRKMCKVFQKSHLS